ncbi:integrin alpha-PS5-like [Diabrotica virgifera virgifera]|uniref:Integrin alpha second immunoglobulin-like domain-containing protein n=1 Tax=Diabrotica virgifera virgifera TaxID=50390 RepID=A0ABM5IMH4_DIAVI|nr:integrin alpha-PS5-like [Diabrotica virgifera virgifera]
MLKFIVAFILITKCVYGEHLNINNVIELELNNTNTNHRSYFGYSLLLQKGNPSQVIVGAPKYSTKNGGAIFVCELIPNKECRQYGFKVPSAGSMNGNFLGLSLDGDEFVGGLFVTCAPRVVQAFAPRSRYGFYRLHGRCYRHENSSLIDTPNIEYNEIFPSDITTRSQVQLGFDIFYQKDKNILTGCVGANRTTTNITSGTILTGPLFDKDLSSWNFVTNRFPESKDYDYIGYKVGVAKYQQNEYVIGGAPRAESCRGQVLTINKGKVVNKIFGDSDALGSYFGSSFLAVDLNNDNSDELFIGAPMTAGNTFDEGCVFYYNDISATVHSAILYGSKRRGARFGTSIVNLGDINLDSFIDIAISAPFEDNGIGAVYIYMGTSIGINETFNQRVTPSTFSPALPNIRGFGIGLSRGLDINNDGYNDIAVGAYQSEKVFVLQSKEIIIFHASLTSDINSISVDKTSIVPIRYCVGFSPKSPSSKLTSLTFSIEIIVDDVVTDRNDNIAIDRSKNVCNEFNATADKPVGDFVPFQISLRSDVIDNVVVEGPKVVTLSIPFIHGCSSANLCKTQLSMNITPKNSQIILGQNDHFAYDVSVKNEGEPGYQCQLNITLPNELGLENGKGCYSDGHNIVICRLGSKLDNLTKSINVNFDMLPSPNLNKRTLDIKFELSCLHGQDTATDTAAIMIDIISSPFIEGKTLQDTIEIFPEDTDLQKQLETVHSYTVANTGTSPVRSDIYILIPTITIKDKKLFEVVESTKDRDVNKMHCSPTNNPEISNVKYNVSSLIKTPENETEIVDCFNKWKCEILFCQGSILRDDTETTVFNVKLKTNSGLLGQFFKKQTRGKFIAAFVTSAIHTSNTTVTGHASTTLLLSNVVKAVPNWVYVVATIVGCLLLVVLILVLFKCNFFEREYRDKLIEERELIEDNNERLPEPIQLDLMEIQEGNEGDANDDEITESK